MGKNILLAGYEPKAMSVYQSIFHSLNTATQIHWNVESFKKQVDEIMCGGVFLKGLDIVMTSKEKYNPSAKPENKFRGGLEVIRYSVEKGIPTLVMEGIESQEFIKKAKNRGAEIISMEMSLSIDDLIEKFKSFYDL